MAELDPVEIDINMRQNVSEESARASQGIEDLAKSSQAAIDAMQKDIERLNGVVDNMNAIIAEQKKQMSGNNEVYGENIKRLEEMEAELNRTKAALSSYTDTSRQMIEASKEGANVTDIITDAQKNLANTETALSGSMGELMDNQKKINGSLDEGTKKVEINSASNKVLSVAIQSTCEALGIENTLITRSISNVGLIAGAKRGWANAVSLLNKELGFSLVASKALVAGGILTGLAAVAALGYGVKYLIDRYKEKTKEMREMREINRQVNTEYSVQASKVKILANEINNENISLELRKKRLNELRAIIPEYHADLNKEGKLINDNKQAIDAYLESLKEEIRLKSQRERLEKLYEKKTLIEEELDDVNDYVKNNKNAQPVIMQSSAGAVIQDSSASLALAENVKRQRELAKEQDDINNQIDKMEKRFNENLENNKSEQEKITRDNLDNRQKYIDGLRDTLKRLEIDSPEYLKVQAELIQKEKELSKITDKNSYKAIDKAEAKAETAAQKLLKQQQTAADKLEKGSVEYQKRIDAARIATMQSGADKERAAIQTEYDQTKDYIMRQLKEIAKLEAITGQPATTQRAELKELDKVAEARYRAETARVNAEAEKAINEIFADVNQKFQSDLDNNLSSINRYYDDIIKKAKLEGATLAQVNELNAKREKETIQARINNRLSQIDFDQEVATRRMEIADKVYLFEADREKDLLSIQLEAAEKRRNALQDGYNNMPTDELAKSLKLAGLEVDNLNKKIQKLPAQKFREMVASISQVYNTMRNTLGDFGISFSDDIGKALDGVGQILNGVESIDLTKPFSAITGSLEALGGVAKAVSGIFGSADYSSYNQLKDKYDGLLDVWNELIDKKNEYLSISAADEINRIESETLELIQKQSEAVKALARERLSAGKSAGSHSLWYRMWKGSYKFDGMNWRDVASEISSSLGGIKFDSMDDMLNMTADQLQWIKENYSGLWAVMDGDFRGYLDQLIQYGDQAKETIEAAKESLTQVSFDSMKDSFLNTLMDMDSDALDFADDFSSYLQKAILKSMLDKTYAKRLQSFYDSFADANRVGGIDKGEYDSLKDEWDNLVNDAIAERDKLKEIFGWESSGSGSTTATAAKGITASQDSVNELNGGMYAVRQTLNESRNLQKEANVYQASMASNLNRITENTEFCRYLPDILRKLSDIESYGIPMK